MASIETAKCGQKSDSLILDDHLTTPEEIMLFAKDYIKEKHY